MVGAIHVVVGGGHDIGPVRLDIGKMRAPRPLRLVEKADRLAGQPWRLAVLLGDIGGLVGIHEHPARGEVARLIDAGIGEIRPRVVAGIPLRLEVFVIGAALFVIEPVRPLAPEPIVALPDVEAAFRLPRADHAVGREAEPFHALRVGLHVGLANEPAAHAEPAQVVAHRVFAHPQREPVPRRPVRRGIAPGIETHPRGAADRRLHIGIGEAHALRRHPVEMRCLQMRMPAAAQVIEPQLVIHDEEYVHPRPPLRRDTGRAVFPSPVRLVTGSRQST